MLLPVQPTAVQNRGSGSERDSSKKVGSVYIAGVFPNM